MAASSVPRLGPYDSADEAVVAQRARWMLEAGVGAINLSWWGRGSFEARTGFFLTFVNSFNEWHEGTQFEPVKGAATLTPREASFGYHNPVDGMYRLNYLKSRLQPILH